jgi:hypothetical protein
LRSGAFPAGNSNRIGTDNSSSWKYNKTAYLQDLNNILKRDNKNDLSVPPESVSWIIFA